MKANLTNSRSSDNIRKARKEDHFYREVTALDPKTGRAVVIARFYWPSSVCYSCVWVHGKTHPRGAGSAGGGGYHKASAAFAGALSDAGITLSEDVGGRGDRAIEDAVEAIARAATGKRKFIIHTSHA